MPPRRDPFNLAPMPSPTDPRPGRGALVYPYELTTSAHYMMITAVPAGGFTSPGPSPYSPLVVLHMPEGMLWTDNHVYTEMSLSEIAGGFMGGISGAVGNYVNKKVTSLGGSPITSLGGVADNISLVGKLGGVPIGTTIEVMYSNTTQRQFKFYFQLTPRSKAEADNIHEIIKSLRYHAAPKALGNTDDLGFSVGIDAILSWIAPHNFIFSVYYNGELNPYIPKVGACALKQIDADFSYFAENRWATFDGGSPVGTYLGLTFHELEPIHKDLIVDGY
jgi:hypothetical protein